MAADVEAGWLPGGGGGSVPEQTRALAIGFRAGLLLVDADSDVRVVMWEEGALPPASYASPRVSSATMQIHPPATLSYP